MPPGDAIVLHPSDTVATALRDLDAGTRVRIAGRQVTLTDRIPFGHKLAITDIEAGRDVVKYGESIGLASSAIGAGSHVHVHNLESRRGRGDRGR